MNYRRAELLIYPSLYEGFGLPLLEAMACGCPVVSSDSASLPEIAGGAAYLANASDPAALAEAIHEVVSNPILREDLRSTGLARAKQFTWEKCAEKTLVAYGKALISDNKS